MTRTHPQIEVTIDGQPVAAAFYTFLIEARVRDEEGQTADSCSFVFDDRNNVIALPRKGGEIVVRLGWRGEGLVEVGKFKVEKTPIRGSAEEGEFLVVEGKAADMRKEIKGEKSRAYENKTLKEIVEAEAGKMGLQATVDEEIGKVKYKWRIRQDQSRMDFLTRLVDEAGGILKPSGGKLIVQKQGSGKSAGGRDLPTITLSKSDCSSWDIDPDGRMQYGKVEAVWIDPKTGKRKIETVQTGLEGPLYSIREPFPDKDRAKRAAEAKKGDLNRGTGNGRLTLSFGRPEATAGCTVILTDFRSGANGEWRASAVEHTFRGGDSGGFETLIELKAKEDGKKGKDDD